MNKLKWVRNGDWLEVSKNWLIQDEHASDLNEKWSLKIHFITSRGQKQSILKVSPSPVTTQWEYNYIAVETSSDSLWIQRRFSFMIPWLHAYWDGTTSIHLGGETASKNIKWSVLVIIRKTTHARWPHSHTTTEVLYASISIKASSTTKHQQMHNNLNIHMQIINIQ